MTTFGSNPSSRKASCTPSKRSGCLRQPLTGQSPPRRRNGSQARVAVPPTARAAGQPSPPRRGSPGGPSPSHLPFQPGSWSRPGLPSFLRRERAAGPPQRSPTAPLTATQKGRAAPPTPRGRPEGRAGRREAQRRPWAGRRVPPTSWSPGTGSWRGSSPLVSTKELKRAKKRHASLTPDRRPVVSLGPVIFGRPC